MDTYTGRFLLVRPTFKIRQKCNLQLFFNRKKSICSARVWLCAIHTMFQKLKIFKTVEMPYKYVRHYLSWMREIMTLANKT